MLPTPEQVKQYIAGGLACEHLEVEGDGQHFFATIVSPQFDGKRPREIVLLVDNTQSMKQQDRRLNMPDKLRVALAEGKLDPAAAVAGAGLGRGAGRGHPYRGGEPTGGGRRCGIEQADSRRAMTRAMAEKTWIASFHDSSARVISGRKR